MTEQNGESLLGAREPAPRVSQQQKRELAELIMAHAIEKVHKLGFQMKVGSRNGLVMKVDLGAMNLFYYSTEPGRNYPEERK